MKLASPPRRSSLRLAVCILIAMFLSGCVTPKKPVPAGQFYHIGFVWLKDAGNPEHRQKIVEAGHAFERKIPEVRSLAVGQSPPSSSPFVDDSFDVCLVMSFEDRAALERYNVHPVHKKAAEEAFLSLSRKILFYDFITE